MGIFKYPPKYNNPNWSMYSAKKKRWEKSKKIKKNKTIKIKNKTPNSKTIKNIYYLNYK